MKAVGRTLEGAYLLEASENEYRLLKHLAKAIEGKSLEVIGIRDDYGTSFPDFSGTFGAIEAFALAHYRVNELQDLLDRFRQKVSE